MSEASADPVLWSVDERGVARVTLNRPQVYNAYNGDMIAALLKTYDALAGKSLARGGDQPARARISRPAPTSIGSTPCAAPRRRRTCAPRA